MELNQSLSQILPPLAYKGLRRAWRGVRGIPMHAFEGCYPDFDAVPTNAVYDDDEIAESIVNSAIYAFQRDQKCDPIADRSGQLLLPSIVSGYNPVTVLDFGGGPLRGLKNIHNYAEIEQSSLNYILVETSAVVRAYKRKMPNFNVISDIPDNLPHPLIVNAAGVIHCISSYRDVLQRLARLRPEVFIVSQLAVSDLPTYARLQLNMPPKRIAQWVFNRAYFLREMSDLGYRCTFAVNHDLSPLHVRAPAPSQIASMIFRP